jgi:hypothetical protein
MYYEEALQRIETSVVKPSADMLSSSPLAQAIGLLPCGTLSAVSLMERIVECKLRLREFDGALDAVVRIIQLCDRPATGGDAARTELSRHAVLVPDARQRAEVTRLLLLLLLQVREILAIGRTLILTQTIIHTHTHTHTHSLTHSRFICLSWQCAHACCVAPSCRKDTACCSACRVRTGGSASRVCFPFRVRRGCRTVWAEAVARPHASTATVARGACDTAARGWMCSDSAGVSSSLEPTAMRR